MRLTCLILGIAFNSLLVFAQALTVAAAADLNTPLTELATAYQKQTGVKLDLVFGSSGNLFTQIENGAPFDLFLSADEDYPQRLVTARLADPASLYRYAVGKLVLWVPATSSLNIEEGGIDALLDPTVKKIAIANPLHAPYGRAAEAVFRHFGIYDKIADRLVLGENVSQAAQFVESGSAQAGLIALSYALALDIKGQGRYWEVPASGYPPLNQALVIVARSRHKHEAAAFVEFLKQPPATAKLMQYGFTVPGEH